MIHNASTLFTITLISWATQILQACTRAMLVFFRVLQASQVETRRLYNLQKFFKILVCEVVKHLINYEKIMKMRISSASRKDQVV